MEHFEDLRRRYSTHFLGSCPFGVVGRMRPGPRSGQEALVAWQDQVSEPGMAGGGGSASEDVGEAGEGKAKSRGSWSLLPSEH